MGLREANSPAVQAPRAAAPRRVPQGIAVLAAGCRSLGVLRKGHRISARAATGQIVAREAEGAHDLRHPLPRLRQAGVPHPRHHRGWLDPGPRREAELMNVLADVRRGLWRPPTVEPTPGTAAGLDVFHEWASKCIADRCPRLRPRAIESWEWALSNHLAASVRPDVHHRDHEDRGARGRSRRRFVSASLVWSPGRCRTAPSTARSPASPICSRTPSNSI